MKQIANGLMQFWAKRISTERSGLHACFILKYTGTLYILSEDRRESVPNYDICTRRHDDGFAVEQGSDETSEQQVWSTAQSSDFMPAQERTKE